jgi:hypothetical protein
VRSPQERGPSPKGGGTSSPSPLGASDVDPGAPGGDGSPTPADYDPTAHPCASDKDCPGDAFTCGPIGVGTVHAKQPSSDHKYCLRKGSGDCCPPAPPPPHR